jgi:hypothetical protein
VEWLEPGQAQLIGYVGSTLIALSMLMNNIWRLRWINLVGASTMAIYGFAIGAVPVLALNLFITCVDVFYLVQLDRSKDTFTTLPFPDERYPYLRRFLEFHGEDIAKYQPDFSLDALDNPKGFFILRNMLSVGLFVYEERGEVLQVHLDYVIPDYRDLRNAHFAYEDQRDGFLEAGHRQYRTTSKTNAHSRYLQRVGFRVSAGDPSQMERPI